ncbi:DUF3618 domain-containing protein [Streptomyces hundungensis]|uniref:DUF3618 domain-containing protein n=1 Tax=Streptomyces hundungensis TaxID=1077946 RepID=UPI001D212FBE|nr:DUF3618 domain-containing protein [Streptomyces sp. MAG02]
MTQSPASGSNASDREQLGQEVEQARHELGRTVEALAAKADVKARAQDRASELKEQVGTRVSELSDEVRAAAHVVQEKLPAPPAPVRDIAGRGARSAREHSTLLFAAAGAGVAGWLLLRRRDRRR